MQRNIFKLLFSLSVVFFAQTSLAFTFTTNLKQGSRGTEVSNLQKILNMSPDTQVAKTGPGSPGNETVTFGSATKAAVIRFQNKYAKEVLAPVSLTKGTGFVGSFTLKKLSALGERNVTEQAPQTAVTPSTNISTLFSKPLYEGMASDSEVKKLQTLLAMDESLYPERAISGTFDSATKKAVQKFQDRYSLATPEQKNTTNYGAVGPKTSEMLFKIFVENKATTTTAISNITTPVVATALINPQTLSVTNSGGGLVASSPAGISCGATCSASYALGTKVTLSVFSMNGYAFTSWAGSCSGVDVCTVTMSTTTSVSATFAIAPTQSQPTQPTQPTQPAQPIPQTTNYTLSVTKSGTGAGSVASSAGISCGGTCNTSLASGTTATLIATPNTGSTFNGWGGACLGTGACSISVSSDTNVTASFALIPVVTNLNLMGIGIATPLDWEGDRLYADIISMSRDFKSGTDANSTTLAPVDADEWPMSDFSFYVWAGLDQMHGTYALSFKGQGTVGSNIGNIPVSYDSTTNTSTGTFQYMSKVSDFLALSFSSTKRTRSSASGSGVTSIKLMRPITPGGAQSYSPSILFNNPLKALIAKFSVIRFMDFLGTNASAQVNWSDRPLPSWASFQRNPGGLYGWEGIGGPWEHVIMLANETGKDAWINMPVRATDAYVRNVALMFAYGSDGVNPYTEPQASPVYPPLNSNLKVYVEYSNELWNFGGAFTQSRDNCQAASDELVSTSGSSPLNWDRVWNNATYGNAGWNWSMCWRNISKRGVEISSIFRSVFGDSAMMSRVRPVLMSQLGNSGASLFGGTQMMLSYYNNMAGNFVATPHSPSYYFYGAGGSGYYNPTPSVSTLDELFADPGMTPAGFTPLLQADAKFVAAMGLKRVAYEGGPSFDNTGNTTRDAISAQAVKDPRLAATMVNMHDAWSNNDGELFSYYSATGDHQWGFTSDIYNLLTPKLLAIDTLNAAPRAPLTFGVLVPVSVAGTAADICSRGWSCNQNRFAGDGSQMTWASYSFRSTMSAPWTVNLSFTSAVNASVAVYVDGVLVGTQSTSGGALSFNAETVDAGLHGVVVRAVSGTFSISSVTVAQN